MRNLAGAGLLVAIGAITANVLPAANGEVTPKPVAPPPPIQAEIPARPVHADMRLRVQCWQKGIKIIDQTDLSGLSLNAVTRQRSVSFKREGDPQPSVFVLPFEDSLCMIQPDR